MAHQTKVNKILQVSALKTYDALTYTHWHPIYNWGPWTLAGENPEFFTFNNIRHDWINKFDKAIIEHVAERGVAVQAGGWQGVYPFLLSTMFNLVYTFEPDPLNFFCLNKNCQQDNVLKYQMGLSDAPGLRQFEVVNAPAYNCLSTGQHRFVGPDPYMNNIQIEKTIDVQAMPLDSFNLPRLDLLILDTEGFNLECLKGAEQTIVNNNAVIISENSHSEINSSQEFAYLQSLGYKCWGSLQSYHNDGNNDDWLWKK